MLVGGRGYTRERIVYLLLYTLEKWTVVKFVDVCIWCAIYKDIYKGSGH